MKNYRFSFLLLIVIALLLVPSFVMAQSKTLSLKEAISYGLSHTNSIINSRLDVSYSKKETAKEISNYLPHISASADYRNYLKLPTTILPGVIVGQPGKTIRARFGSNNDINTGIKADQTLFDPGLISSIQASKVNENIAENNLNIQKKDIILIIKQDYFNALAARENLKLSRHNVHIYHHLFGIAKAQYNSKQLDLYGLNEVNTRYENQKQQVVADSLDYLNNLAQLKLDIGYSSDQPFDLTDSTLIEIAQQETHPVYMEPKLTMASVPELRSLQLQKDLNFKKIQENRRNYLPTIKAYAFLGSQYFNNRFLPTNTNYWYGTSYIGINISLPIFDGLQKSTLAQELSIKQTEYQNDIRNFMTQFPDRVVIARRNIDIALRNAKIMKSNYRLSIQKLKMDQNRYHLGLAQWKNILNTEIQLNNDQINYQSALQNLINAQLQYDKLISK